MFTKCNAIVLTCCLMLTLGSLAQASTVQLRDSASSSGYFVSGTAARKLKIKEGSKKTTISTGTFNFEMRESDRDPWTNFQAYCIELTQTIKFGHHPHDTTGMQYDVVDLGAYNNISSDDVNFMGTLWANAFDLSQENKVAAAAFQALIWEAASDTTFDLGDDWFELHEWNSSFTTDVKDLAEQWVDNINDNIWTGTVDLYVLKNATSQDFITASTVPEPSSMALALLGGMMLLGRGRRKNRIA